MIPTNFLPNNLTINDNDFNYKKNNCRFKNFICRFKNFIYKFKNFIYRFKNTKRDNEKNIYRKFFEAKTGATSILVIFLLVVLVTLGAFAIVSANINYKFSAVVSKWNVKYYGLVNTSVLFMADVDNVIIESENNVVEYMINKKFLDDKVENLPDEAQKDVYNLYNESVNKDAVLNDIVIRLYDYFLKNNLSQLRDDYQDLVIYSETGSNIHTEINFESTTDKDMYLLVKLKIEPINYTFAMVDGDVVGKKIDGSKRFVIESWKQWQTPVDHES